MQDDAIRERHGVKTVKASAGCRDEVLLREGEDYVNVSLGNEVAHLTPWQARYLAAKLYRISRRIRNRTEGEVK